MSFTFNGIHARNMNMRVSNDFTKSHTKRDVEVIAVSGRDGDIVIDNRRYESISQSIPINLMTEENVENVASNIANWLLIDTRYYEFVWDDDPDFIIKAMYLETFDLNVVLRNFGRTVLTFNFHPIKYLKESLQETYVANNSTINNPFAIAAKPLIKIMGNGNINLTIANSTPLVLQGVDGGIIIDSDTQTVTSLDGQRTQFDKMYSYPFPEIKPGNNQITYTGATSVTIVKRLGALI